MSEWKPEDLADLGAQLGGFWSAYQDENWIRAAYADLKRFPPHVVAKAIDRLFREREDRRAPLLRELVSAVESDLRYVSSRQQTLDRLRELAADGTREIEWRPPVEFLINGNPIGKIVWRVCEHGLFSVDRVIAYSIGELSARTTISILYAELAENELECVAALARSSAEPDEHVPFSEHVDRVVSGDDPRAHVVAAVHELPAMRAAIARRRKPGGVLE